MSGYRAFPPISTAFEKTKKILFEPFNVITWIKLAIIVFFIGSSGSRLSNTGQYRTGPYDDYSGIGRSLSDISSDTNLMIAIIALILLVLILALVLFYLRGVFSFVFIRALTTFDVRILKPFRENMGRGFKIFLFNLFIVIISIVLAIILIGIMVFAIVTAVNTGLGSLPAILLVWFLAFIALFALLALIVLLFLMTIVAGFTYDFVAPLMYFKDMGVIDGWKYLWKIIKSAPDQFVVYVLTRWALEFVVGILLFILMLPIIFLMVAVAILSALVAAALSQVSVYLMMFFIGLLILAILLGVLILLFISMPVAVYFRYYSLDFLKEMDNTAVVY
ncbi:hypothetical protein CUJ83_13420 [Methanocella sp. CWC-04]|uniref:DUF4013 domain-containing protein n=1 Tax=Methanooceanicella nereidis TaxID=2052831 RepID=A0AAP2RGW9_9EURY|nr:hypothetical protein [Methanocella sp. CWC-04]MCD1295997.1 hypothetical protein [Methanocella sp. CWC-04]